MNKKIFTTLVITLILGVSQSAFAEHLCDADIKYAISAIYTQHGDGQFLSKRAEYDVKGLVGKLEAAMDKLRYGKTADADQKVSDAQYKLDQLIGGGKRKLADDGYDAISYELDVVSKCIAPFLPSD